MNIHESASLIPRLAARASIGSSGDLWQLCYWKPSCWSSQISIQRNHVWVLSVYYIHLYTACIYAIIYIVPVLYIHQFNSSWYSFSLLPARKTASQKRNLKSGSMPEPTTKPKRFVWNILDSFLFGQYQQDKKKSTAQQLVLEATNNAWSKWVFQPRSSLWCLMISRQSQYLLTWMFHWSFNAILFFFQCSSASYHVISMLC